MKNLRYIILGVLPLLFLTSCSSTNLTNYEVRDQIDLILFNQRDNAFSIPSKITLNMKLSKNINYININESTYDSFIKKYKYVYDLDNYYFSYTYLDEENESVTLLAYIKEANLYVITEEENVGTYRVIYNNPIDEFISIVNKSNFKKLLFGESAVNEISIILENSLVSMDDYLANEENGTMLDRYNFAFKTSGEGNLNIKEEIMTTFIDTDDDTEVMRKKYQYHNIVFDNNILNKNYFVNDYYYRYKVENDIIRYENIEENFSLTTYENADLVYPSLDDFQLVL